MCLKIVRFCSELVTSSITIVIYEFINSTIGKCFEVALLSFLREYCCTLSMEACLMVKYKKALQGVENHKSIASTFVKDRIPPTHPLPVFSEFQVIFIE